MSVSLFVICRFGAFDVGVGVRWWCQISVAYVSTALLRLVQVHSLVNARMLPQLYALAANVWLVPVARFMQ